MSSDARREAILEVAARLFGHYGYAKTTVADIARETHMGVGTCYLVFTSKEEIVEELSSRAHDRVLSAMREVADARTYDSFSERLTGVLERRVAVFLALAEEGQHACELLHCKSGPVKSVHARFREQEEAMLGELFEQALVRGELAALDVKRAVALVQRAYATLSPPWLYEHPPEESQRAAYEMSRLLLLGLMSRGEGTRASAQVAEPKPAKPKPKRSKPKPKPKRSKR